MKPLPHYEDMLARFHVFWKDKGEPHPSSNAYLDLTRRFFYAEGYVDGLRERSFK